MKKENNSLLILKKYSFIHEAELTKTILSNYGIESFVYDKNLNVVIGTAFVEGYRLAVHEQNFERANEILEKHNNNSNK